MDADWITSPSARRVLQHAQDSRPAWLWSQDGQLLLWHNDSAALFLAKVKKHRLKLAPPALPIKGQIARNIRLGSIGRTSLARIQFLAGEKPASATCATTPLLWQDGQSVLLVVGVDPIAEEIIAAADASADQTPEEAAPVVAPSEQVDQAPQPQVDDVAALADAHAALAEPEIEAPQPDTVADLIVDDEHAYERELENWRSAEPDGRPAIELVPTPEPLNAESTEQAPEPGEPSVPATSRLSALMDRMAADEDLFTPLTEADDTLPAALTQAPEADATPDLAGNDLEPDEHAPELMDAEAVEPEQTESEVDIGDLVALDGAADPELADFSRLDEGTPLPEAGPEPLPSNPNIDIVERTSRYNFDELSRILNDRVGEPARPAVPALDSARTGALINLGGETLVLNRLPLGILVFRDQQVLFANRAITEMVGYDTVENLRAAGLAAVFPAAGPQGDQNAGPVNHLMQRDGTLVPVTARLQSISWQGRPALMLSASATEVRTGHEAAVQAFAQAFADVRGDGFFEATRAGVISAITPRAVALLRSDTPLEGKALSALVTGNDLTELRVFLERPARFAESARPCLTLRALSGAVEIILFAQGQAGVLTGYFGFVRARETAAARLAGPADADPALLARISRGVRRPLNTIIGFSDLIRSEAFGALKNERYESYAQDITTAGNEIAALVDELDDYARLRDGRYLPQRASIELTALLESCVVRIRQQASGARVIVRNAISESLPRITADRASLAQAVLNLLASAIDQTPTGGAVVISAQLSDDGGIAVHVRDSSTNAVDMAERFVVFRDGPGRDGQMMTPVRSSVGLALTRSLLAVNAFSLSVDPAGEQGMLFTLMIPADLIDKNATPEATV